jgi:hypothetical protein
MTVWPGAPQMGQCAKKEGIGLNASTTNQSKQERDLTR